MSLEQELKKLKKTKEELEENAIIKEYLSLCKKIEQYESLKYDSNSAFNYIALTTKNDSDILVYMGAYKHDEFKKSYLVDIQSADYVLYTNLETLNRYKINPNELVEFEKLHNIIHLPLGKSKLFYDKEFSNLRKKFFDELLIKSQNDVIKEMVKGIK